MILIRNSTTKLQINMQICKYFELFFAFFAIFFDFSCIFQKKVLSLQPICENLKQILRNMRTKSLLLTLAFCGAFVSMMAQEPEAVDTTALGVHPYKTTANMAKPSTGFSLIFHGGMNIFRGDYPGDRFNNLGYGGGINFEYNFSPVWGLGAAYGFDWTQVKTKRNNEGFRDIDGTTSLTLNAGELVHQGMMHKGQVYVTFNMVNAWFPRAVKDIFALHVFAGLGGALYHNNVSFHDTGELNALGKLSDSGKYVKDGDAAHAHKVLDANGNPTNKDKYETVGYIPLGASAEFNVSRSVALGARVQYNMFLNDYVDNRYQSPSNKRNDGSYNIDLSLRIKLAAEKKNHVMNVASFEVMEEKYYESHPEERIIYNSRVDTLVVYHKDTIVIVHRDTVVIAEKRDQIVSAVVEQQTPAAATPAVAPAQRPATAPTLPGEQMTEERREVLHLEEDWTQKDETKVVEGQSLSQLARRYYHNTFCWVYLWLANRSVAPDPNLILPKCQIKVPALTADQKTITKEEAKAIAAKYRE